MRLEIDKIKGKIEKLGTQLSRNINLKEIYS